MTYGLTQSLQLMQNHVPADVLDAVDGFSAYLTPADAYVVLAIGSDSIYRAAVEVPGSATGWGVYDISDDLATQIQQLVAADATYVAKMAASSLDTTTGTLIALLAVTVKSATAQFDADMLFALSGPANVDPSLWLGDESQRTWTVLPFSPANLPGLLDGMNSGNLSVTRLTLEMGIDATAPSLALAAAANPSDVGEAVLFTLNTAGGAQAWSYFPQEQDLGVIAGLDEGRMADGDYNWGIYKLYSLNDDTSLTFLPAKAAFGPGPGSPVLFQPPAGASAVASLVYGVSARGGSPFTDLFVAGDGTITCFPYDAPNNSAGTVVVRSGLVSNVTQLHAVNAGETAYLWGFAQDANDTNGTIFYCSAPIGEIESPSGWSQPVALLTGVSMATALYGTPVDQLAVCAVGPVPSNAATSGAVVAPQILALNPSTGHWGTSILPMPTTDDCLTLQTYTSRVQLTDGAAPLGGQSVGVTPSIDCSLMIKGQATYATAGTALTLTTDASGCVNLVYPVSSLAGASFTFVLPDGSTVAVNAAQDTIATLQTVSASTLATTTFTNAQGQSQQLVPAGTPSDTVTAVATASNSLASLSTTLPSASESTLSARRAKARALHASLGDSSILMDLGDLVQFVGNVLEGIMDVAVNLTEQGWQIVVSTAEAAFSAFVQTAEDALHAILSVFAWIEATFEDLFQWLAFLFDWETFVQVHDILVATVNAALTSAANGLDDLVDAAVAFLGHLEQNVFPNFDANTAFAAVSGGSTSGQVFNAKAGAPPAVGGANLQSDSRIGWVNDRASTPPNPSAATGARRPRSASPGDAMDDLESATATIVASLGTLAEQLAGDVADLATGKSTPQQFLSAAAAQIVATGVSDLTTLVQQLGNALEQVVPMVQDYLNDEIDIPILSALFRVATKDDQYPDGQNLTVLSLICLLQGIAFSITYKIAEDADPVAYLNGVDLPTTVTGALANLPIAINGKSGADGSAPVRPAAGLGDADGVDIATGCFLIAQGVSSFVVAMNEIANTANAPSTVKQSLCNAYIFDLTTRFLRGACEESDASDPDYGGAALIPTELMFHFFLLFWVGYVAATSDEDDDWDAGRIESIMRLDEVVSLGWGIWEICNMANGEIECDLGHGFEVGIELTELATSLLCEKAAENPNPDTVAAAAGLAGLRCISAIGAGCMRL